MAPNEGAYTNPDEMGHYQTHKTSLRNAINHRFAKTFVKDPATRPQVGLVGPGLPLRCHQHSVLRADNIPPPLLAHPTAHGGSLYSTGYSESESENDVEEGTFAPETPNSSPCHRRFRFSTQRELDTYFDSSSIENMAYNMNFALEPDDFNGAHCLLSLAMSSGR
ncbi:hypothetical protein E4T56_gene17505 [Termitomyces sp. T112]|nr:hypothetical protein E4T56_gene17505 [Termitomyces sp. T112]